MLDSSVPGILAGLVLASLIGYAIYLYLEPLRGQNSGLGLAFAALVVLWIAKTFAIHWCPGFYIDVDYFRELAIRLAAVGPAHFYGPGYSAEINYPPGAIYPLWPFAALGHALNLSWESLRIPVETPPLLADLLLGTTMFAWLRRSGRSLAIAWAGMLL
ncbi:MAG: hypothetical protein ABSG46_11095, partial [Candidatus Binataceae bacterium]